MPSYCGGRRAGTNPFHARQSHRRAAVGSFGGTIAQSSACARSKGSTPDPSRRSPARQTRRRTAGRPGNQPIEVGPACQAPGSRLPRPTRRTRIERYRSIAPDSCRQNFEAVPVRDKLSHGAAVDRRQAPEIRRASPGTGNPVIKGFRDAQQPHRRISRHGYDEHIAAL